MTDETLKPIVAVILVFISLFFLLVIVGGFNISGSIFYSGCTGEVEGPKIITKTNEWILTPRCTIYSDKGKIICESAYKPIKKEIGDFPVCVWIGEGSENQVMSVPLVNNVPQSCVFNPDLSCEDFSQQTEPKCQDLPRCKPVSVFEKLNFGRK